MRGKWVLAAGATLALVVVGGVGGLTMRAFAGVAHTTVKTSTVTRFCVYVDRTNGGESYGDVTVVPKYKHKVCIVGKRGTPSVITWNKTIAEPVLDAPRMAGLGGPPPGTVDLATVGPFTVRGECLSGDGVGAITGVVSAQDGSSLTWNGNEYNGTFNNGDGHWTSNWANGSSQNPDWANEGPSGDFSVTTADQMTAFTGFANNGVYINGPEGPACSFTGYLVLEK